jgi:hypothetical protein
MVIECFPVFVGSRLINIGGRQRTDACCGLRTVNDFYPLTPIRMADLFGRLKNLGVPSARSMTIPWAVTFPDLFGETVKT